QKDGELLIRSITYGEQPLPVVTQVSLSGTAPNSPPVLKDPKLHMRESAYGEQVMKAVILYEYETIKTTEGEQLLDTYLGYLQVINDIKKCGYKKDNCELNYEFLNNLLLNGNNMLGDYDTWRLRIESYIQLQDYALWMIIEDGNSFKPVARTTINADGTSTSTIPSAVTEAKTLFEAIEARFSSNEATKKTQKTLLKQISLPYEWSMLVVVWWNKPDLGSISFDDLYNNFKIVEQEVKRSVISSSNSSSQNVAFVSTRGSTNDVNTSNVHVSTASSSLSTASTTDNTASTTDNTARLSDATIYAFLANQPNGSE
ncbi:hypothetical protein Tco_1025485, partial [Tanacetum coccineum]